MEGEEDIRVDVRAALAVAAFNVDSIRNWHIETLARHCQSLLAEVGRLRAAAGGQGRGAGGDAAGIAPREG